MTDISQITWNYEDGFCFVTQSLLSSGKNTDQRCVGKGLWVEELALKREGVMGKAKIAIEEVQTFFGPEKWL